MTPKFIAIAGVPGSGKTTLAARLADALWYLHIESGNVARNIDPGSIARGELADETLFRRDWIRMMADLPRERGVVFDGIPRNQAQLELLPPDVKLILLTCRIDIARDRQFHRGRPGDTPEVIEKRTTEQAALLGVEGLGGGWLHERVGWTGCVNTTNKPASMVYADVLAYVTGRKKEAF